MISEVVNALFITYVATEYTVSSSSSSSPPSDGNTTNSSCFGLLRLLTQQQRRIALLAIAVVVVNVLDQVTGAGTIAHQVVDKFLHVPKVIFAAILYVLALYKDCKTAVTVHGSSKSTSFNFKTDFLPRVLRAFCLILPVYPVAAVLISFGFLFVINLFELLHLPVSLLNWPIYYGTLYGPFSYIYFTVKRNVVAESQNILPMSHQPPRRLGRVL